MSGDRKRTPIRDIGIEMRSIGSGPVIPYNLSPEELARYRAMPVEGRRNHDGIKTKRPFALRENVSHEALSRANKPNESEGNEMRKVKEGPSCGLTRQLLLDAVASGETLASVERAWGMKNNAIHNWVKKWELKGINPDRARELLGGGKQLPDQVGEQKGVITKPGVSGVGRASDNPPSLNVSEEKVNELLKFRSKLEAENTAEGTADSGSEDLKAVDQEQKSPEALLQAPADPPRAMQQNKEAMFLWLKIPVVDVKESFGDQLSKVEEEIDEFAREIRSWRGRQPALSEALDIVQSLIGALYLDMAELLSPDQAAKKLKHFVVTTNKEHTAKIERYAAERDWKVIEQ